MFAQHCRVHQDDKSPLLIGRRIRFLLRTGFGVTPPGGSVGSSVVVHSKVLIPAALHKRCPVILNPDSPENNTIGK